MQPYSCGVSQAAGHIHSRRFSKGLKVVEPDAVSGTKALCRTWPPNGASVQLIFHFVTDNENCEEGLETTEQEPILTLKRKPHYRNVLAKTFTLEFLRFLSLNLHCSELWGFA